MKKLFLVFIFVFLLSTSAYAKTGDIIGYIYETDILAYVNGIEVPSYNIGGKTVIVVEDTTKNFIYNDELRTLIIGGFAPSDIIKNPSKESSKVVIGKKVGYIYETDIRTYIRGKEIQCYALNGKMAVAIEDLGADNTFTATGGKFVWNPKERTIKLEFIYNNIGDIKNVLEDKKINLNINEKFMAEFINSPIMNGGVYSMSAPNDSLPQQITFNGQVLGYIYYPKNVFTISRNSEEKLYLGKEEGQIYHYFYPDAIKMAVKNIAIVEPTRTDWIEYFKDQLMEFIEVFETDKYTFLYMSQPTSHGNTQMLKQVYDDGTVISYENKFEADNIWGIKQFTDVKIDKEKKTVSFTRINGDKYKIDLETGIMTKID